MITLRFLAGALSAALALGACGDDDAGNANDAAAGAGAHGGAGAGDVDAGAGDGGPSDAGPACSPALDGESVDVKLAAGMSWPTFVASDDGVVGISTGPNGYRMLDLDRHGAVRTPTQALWPSETGAQTLQLALSGDVLAIVDQRGVGPNQRQQCRLALARPSSGVTLRAPTRFSDETQDDSILHEVGACLVGALDDGFLLVWWQNDSASSDESKLFAQRVGRDGAEMGDRITVEAGSAKYELALATNGGRALIAHAGRKATGSLLTLIDGDGAHEVPLTIDVHVQALRPAHDGFLALGQEQAWTLDRDGHVVKGPLDLPLGTSIAPFSDGYATLGSEEYLSVRVIDATLRTRSEPLGLSNERDAHAEQLLTLTDGSWGAALYSEHGQLRFAPLACGETKPPPVGPSSCQRQQPLTALDDQCDEEVCHVLIRLDYLTLHVRGWSAIGGPRMSVDASGAEAAANEAFAPGSEYLGGPTQVSGPAADVFTVSIEPSDFGAVALVGADSGLVIMAAGEVWSGRGDYWTPTAWNPASDVACGDEVATPSESQLDEDSCTLDPGNRLHGSASDALDVALHTNLAAHLAAQGAFSARVLLYTPAVGSCDASVADYVVVLTQTRE